MAKHFTYDDVDIYDEDVSLFSPGKWLNTNCIHFGLRVMEHEPFFIDGGTDCIIALEPSIESFVRFQLETEEELDGFREGVDLDSKRWVFVPVNSHTSILQTGSHWSLLAYHVPSSTGIHMDSMNGANNQQATDLMNKLNKIVSAKSRKEPTFISLPPSVCPQQQDSFNCGVYLLLLTNSLARSIVASKDSAVDYDDNLVGGTPEVWTSVFAGIVSSSAGAYRSDMLKKIEHLK
jgi:hypothetical protein